MVIKRIQMDSVQSYQCSVTVDLVMKNDYLWNHKLKRFYATLNDLLLLTILYMCKCAISIHIIYNQISTSGYSCI